VADRKPFLLRIDRETLDAVQRWADDDLRSLNGQIEFLLRRALRDAGRAAPETSNVERVTPKEASPETSNVERRTSKEAGKTNQEGNPENRKDED
jgi:hypothetical protein